MNGQEKIPNMGEKTSRVFRGEHISEASREMYGETADFFANKIKERLQPKKEPYILLDAGSFQGELLDELLKRLPGYKFSTIALDINGQALENNQIADKKMVADAENMPLADSSIDVVIARNMLQWNNAEKQKRILREIARVVKEFALVEHVGADTVNAKDWRDKMDDLLDGVEVPRMKRGEHFFSSRQEVEEWLKRLGISFDFLRERKIDNGLDVYIDRYGLNHEEAETARRILAEKNYFMQTGWLIYPVDKPNR